MTQHLFWTTTYQKDYYGQPHLQLTSLQRIQTAAAVLSIAYRVAAKAVMAVAMVAVMAAAMAVTLIEAEND